MTNPDTWPCRLVIPKIKQQWRADDWDWSIKDNDIAENRLTIKFRKGKARWATYFALKWN